MEKIYEESTNESKQKRVSLATVLSFVVAVFAIVSLIAVGFNQISYAAPGGTLTVKAGIYPNTDPPQPAGINAVIEGSAGGASDGSLFVPRLFSDSNNVLEAQDPVFCIEHGIDYSTRDGAYQSDGEVFDDLGLVYILNQTSLLGGPGIVTDINTLKYPGTQDLLETDDKKALETYVTQAAIWLYMNENYAPGDTRHGKLEEDHQMDVLKGDAAIYSTADPSTEIYVGNVYNKYIKNVVNAAENTSNYKTVKAVLSSTSISTVGQNKDTYQTDKITVSANPSSDLVDYSVTISGLDGAYVADKDGNKVDEYHVFQPTDYFYIRVPVNKVTDQQKTVNIEIVGSFRNYVGGEYFLSSGNEQKIVAVTHENFRIANRSTINFMASKDTGMSTAQTIYFIGLIVLLCGVGIIYANAKPVEEK